VHKAIYTYIQTVFGDAPASIDDAEFDAKFPSLDAAAGRG
jgi:hypothetical protein